MRAPTPQMTALAWWRRAVAAGGRIERHEGEPQAGWYKRRMVRGGPWVPVRIWLHQEIDPETSELEVPEILRAEQNGRPVDPQSIWTHCHPISRDEYEALVDRQRTMSLMAATHARLDLTATPIGPRD